MQLTLDVIWRVVGVLGGFALIVFGLAAWLGRVWAERILEKDRQHYREELERLKVIYEAANKSVQAELDKRSHVYRVQFEAEFRALSEIWEKIVELRARMAAIRPVLDPTPVGNDPMERYRPRLVAFSQTLQELKALVFKYAPFYPPDIYELLWSLLQLAIKEEVTVGLACNRGERPAVNWCVDGQKEFDAMVSQATGVSNAIRQRVQKLSFND